MFLSYVLILRFQFVQVTVHGSQQDFDGFFDWNKNRLSLVDEKRVIRPPTRFLSGGSSTVLSVADSWTYDLPGLHQSSYGTKVVVIDLFDTTKEEIANLKSEERVVVCYFSAGSFENWRDDRDDFPDAIKGEPLDGWAGETWLDTRASAVWDVMSARIRLAKEKGCQAVEPDNVDGWSNDTGFPLSEQDSKYFLTDVLADKAHKEGLLIALKNCAEIAADMQPTFDFAIVEECYKWNECCSYFSFIENGKPVFAIEYPKNQQSLCATFVSNRFSLIFGNYPLDQLWFCPVKRTNAELLVSRFRRFRTHQSCTFDTSWDDCDE